MRKIKEVLRLKWGQGMSNRKIAASSGIGRPTVSEYLRRATEAGLSWPLPAGLDDARLERMLFPPPPDLPAQAFDLEGNRLEMGPELSPEVHRYIRVKRLYESSFGG